LKSRTMQWLLLVVVLVSLVAVSSAELKVRNKQCKFPFRYKDHTYHYCTSTDGATPWCAMDEEYVAGRYVQCYPSVCVFPFVYKNKTYDSCTKEDSGAFWCSGTKIYNDVYYPCKDFEGAYDVTIYCVGMDKTKYSIGQSWNQGCTTFRCLDEGRFSYSANCPGVNGKCHKIGEENFPCLIQNVTYNQCACKGNDQSPQLQYSMRGEDEVITKETKKTEGKVIRCDGRKQWTEDCQDYECNEGMPVPKATRCRDHKQQCFNLNTNGFKCHLEGDDWNNCSCSLEPRTGRPMLSAKSA